MEYYTIRSCIVQWGSRALRNSQRCFNVNWFAKCSQGLKDIDIQLDVIIHSDSAAARGMVKINGLGKVRHIHVQELWVQDALREGRFKLQCVLGYDNCADLLTKHLEEKSMVRHAERIGLAILSGRSEIAPHMT